MKEELSSPASRILVFDRQLIGDRNYWREKLQNSIQSAGLPRDFERLDTPAERTHSHVSVSVEGALYQTAFELTRGESLLVYTIILSSVQICLHLYHDLNRITIGSPPRGTDTPPNAVCLTTELAPASSYKEHLVGILKVVREAYAHQSYPFDMLIRDLRIETNGAEPLLPVVLELEGFNGRLCQLNSDLLISISQKQDRLDLQFSFDPAVHRKQTVAAFASHVQNVLALCLRKPEIQISEIELLSTDEKRRMLDVWNETRRTFLGPRTFPEMFEAQAAAYPDRIAAVCGAAALTYAELDARAAGLAHHLRGMGVAAEARVGVFFERSLEMLVALLGILKAGGAYVPLDTRHPASRLNFILSDARVELILTQTRLREGLPAFPGVICLDAIEGAPLGESSPAPREIDPENLAYVLYTSGSTGRPKGVMIPHRGLANYLNWCIETYAAREGGGTLVHSSIGFDLTITGLLAPLAVGQKVILLEETEGVEILAKALGGGRDYTLVKITPAHLELLSQLMTPSEVAGRTRTFVIGGEELSGRTLEFWRQHAPQTRLINEYGPTETVVGCCVHETNGDDAGGSVPIGRPIANTQLYVLDRQWRMVPVGMKAELYIAGTGVGRGYINRPEHTAERFLPNPYGREPGSRMYRTGDWAQYLPDGKLLCLGRVDRQIKVRGYRIEVEEIEAVLREHQDITGAAVLARENASGGKNLVAYVATREGSRAGWDELRQFAKTRLPDYMVPTGFVLMPALPLTGNGKVDRKALLALGQDSADRKLVLDAPRTPIEETLLGIWIQLLRINRIGIHENFFELGGHSLMATQVMSRVRGAFGVQLSLLSLFNHPTIAALSPEIETAVQARKREMIPPLAKRQRKAWIPMSFAQERLWFIDQFQPGNAAYNVPGTYRINGPFNLVVWEQAITEIVRRHEVLRTTFDLVDGRTVQVIHPSLPAKLSVVSLEELAGTEKKQELRRLMLTEAQQPFHLATGPLLRVTAVCLTQVEHVVFVTLHHIVADGWSMGILLKEFALLHEKFSRGDTTSLPELPLQYADFALWQRDWLQGDALKEQLDYWETTLEGAPAVIPLPTDRPRPAIQTSNGMAQPWNVNRETTEALRELSRKEGVTLFITFLAAFKVLLTRWSNHPDVIVGTPIANRNHEEIECLVGFFVNTLVLRTDLSGDPDFSEALQRVRKAALGAYDHQDIPFEKVVERVQPERVLSHNPLFQVLFTLDTAPAGTAPGRNSSPQPSVCELRIAKFDLSLLLTESDEGIAGGLEYNSDLFDNTTIVRMLKHLGLLLEEVVADPKRRISELNLLNTSEREQMLVSWNNTAVDYPREKSIHRLFEEQAERNPDAIAVAGGDLSMTYRELNTRANQWSRHLRKRGVGPEVVVGICVERSLEMVIGLLAILKAGGVYAPLDPAYPASRLAFMMADAEPRVLLLQKRLAHLWPDPACEIVFLDSDVSGIEAGSSENLPDSIVPDNGAYLMYTSGSTGIPKGITIAHRGVARLIMRANYVRLDSDEVILQMAPISFDASTFEIWGALLHGARLVLAPPGVPDLDALARLLREHRVTTLWLTAGLFHRMVEMHLPAFESVRQLLAGGDVLSPAHCRTFLNAHRGTLINGYGPTEATTFACCHRMDCNTQPEFTVPIGRPISNTQVYILDPHCGPVPPGIAGELHIGGDGLARGYHKRPDLTAEKFMPDPLGTIAGARLYRTGDLCRYLPNGNIEFLGRKDMQVKLRGFRIELGEIESALARHPAVKRTIVILREDKPGEKNLAGYVVLADEAVTVAELKQHLRERLPEYMVPAFIVPLQNLPLTRNGKIDREALPVPERPLADSAVIPRTPEEKTLADLWMRLLEIKNVGVNENFFEIGGHSLLATRLVSEIRKTFAVELPLLDLFENPTIQRMAEKIPLLRRTRTSSCSPLVAIQPAGSKPPLFLVHAADGGVSCYVPLAAYLGSDQPVYGLQAPETLRPDRMFEPASGDERYYESVEEIAAYYIESLWSIVPEGPFYLAGWSMGGSIAFEMAQQLKRRGHEVAFLGLLDTLNLQGVSKIRRGDEAMVLKDMAAKTEAGKNLKLSLESCHDADPVQRFNYVLDQLCRAGILPNPIDSATLRRLRSKLNSYVFLLNRYVPRIYNGEITFFRSEEINVPIQEIILEWRSAARTGEYIHTLGWNVLSTRPIQILDIPGKHEEAVREPFVQTVAARMKARLQECHATFGRPPAAATK